MKKRLPDCLIDLHLHLDGSLDKETVKTLAIMQNIDIPFDEKTLLKELTVGSDCHDLNEYLDKFKFPLKLLQTKEAIMLAVYQLKEKLKAQGLIYAEIRFAPQLHLQKGLTMDEVVEAACRGLQFSDFKAKLILCAYRGEGNDEENMETVRLAAKYLDKGVCAVDLAGAEALFPTKKYKKLFELAKQLNVPFTIHAGEADGPESVRLALKYGAKRLGHGIRSVEDQSLLRKLKRDDIILELCPTSNIQTCIYDSLEDYPIDVLMKNKVRFTINTDNMTVSGTDIRKEMENVIDRFRLNKKQVKQLLFNSVEASFTSEKEKEELRKTIEAAML